MDTDALSTSDMTPPETAAPKPKRQRKRPRTIVIILRCILLTYVVWLIVGLFIQRGIMFPRSMANRDMMADPEGTIAGLERSWLDIDGGGRVEVWFIPGNGVSAEHPGPAVMFTHGNAELIDHQTRTIYEYKKRGVSVMLCEYRGYGRSGGKPTKDGLIADAVAAYDQLAKRPDVDPKRIALHGRSVGTGVACGVAAERKVAAVILRSPFYSIRSMMIWYGVWGPLVLDPFDNAAALKAYGGPVLIMHGTRDEVIAFSQGKRLHEAIDGSTFVTFPCGHNDFPESQRKHWDAIEALLHDAGVLK
ncbi:MAG: prolyl oligopeptidase family serine peptidase [Phycisphaera sp.]|nr:prolyl oligopeptidase family serine peptidase [Phycisphaera sp.]